MSRLSPLCSHGFLVISIRLFFLQARACCCPYENVESFLSSFILLVLFRLNLCIALSIKTGPLQTFAGTKIKFVISEK